MNGPVARQTAQYVHATDGGYSYCAALVVLQEPIVLEPCPYPAQINKHEWETVQMEDSGQLRVECDIID